MCHFISNTKDCLREAKRLGFVISTILNRYYDIIILELTKSRETNYGLLALAEEHIKVGGKMIINGDNQVGVKSFLKNMEYPLLKLLREKEPFITQTLSI